MDTQIEQATGKQVHKILQDIANFIALYEQADDKLKARQQEIDNSIQLFKRDVEQELQNIKLTVTELTEVMTAAGAARWRMAAEKALQEGEQHLNGIKDATKTYQKLVDDSISRLDNVSVSTEKRINKALHQLNEDNFSVVDEFKRKTQEAYERVDAVASGATQKIARLLKWMRWDRFAIAIIAALVSSLLTSMYVNAEWPWESNESSYKERLIGATLLTVWPSLNEHEKGVINQVLGKTVS